MSTHSDMAVETSTGDGIDPVASAGHRPSGWAANGAAARMLYRLVIVASAALMLASLIGYYGGEHGTNDFTAFNAFSRFIHTHPAGSIYDQALLRRFENLPGHGLYAFMYPPGMMLLLWPLAYLSYGVGAAVWLVLFLAVYAGLVGRHDKAALIFAIVAPSTLWTLLCGQSSLLVAALLVGGLRLAPSRPIVAGLLLGLATYKPQFGLLIPIALAAAGRWRTMVAAVATASSIFAATSICFGISVWSDWVHHLGSIAQVRSAHATSWAPLLATVTSNLSMFGVPLPVANVAQMIAAAFAAVCVYRCFRQRSADNDLSVACFACAAILATPFAFTYDLPLFTAGIILFVRERRQADGIFEFREILAILAGVMMPAFVVSGWLQATTSLVVLLFLILILQRAARRAPMHSNNLTGAARPLRRHRRRDASPVSGLTA